MILTFKVFGDFAHFRKFYTTSSPLTFPFPPPPTVRGMVGAIAGFDKDEYLQKTEGLRIGIKINAPVKKIRLGLNLSDTKNYPYFKPPWERKKKTPLLRTQVKAEFLKNPSFTLYLGGDGELLRRLYELLKEHKTHYTLSLGLSELLAGFELVGMLEAKSLERADRVDSVVPVRAVKEIDLSRAQKIGKERIPVHMSPGRRVLSYEDVLFSTEGAPIYAQAEGLYELENGEVVWLWEATSTLTRGSR